MATLERGRAVTDAGMAGVFSDIKRETALAASPAGYSVSTTG